MNRNEIIGTLIGKTLGYSVQGYCYSQIARALNPQSVFLVKSGTKYIIKLIKVTSKSCIRTDFRSETIFSESIDASFFAD